MLYASHLVFASGHEAAKRLRSTRVLVVDDDPDILEMLRVVLQLEGAQVRVAPTAVQALALLQEFHPDVLVSDLMMPVRDGFWLIRKIRSLEPKEGGATPAIALTGFGREHGPGETTAAGFQVHLTKPVTPDTLTSAVRSVRGAQ